MVTSCGILFLKNGQILLGHTTGQWQWDIPKGKLEPGEGFLDAAIRETKEETNFDVNPSDTVFLDEVPYRKGKRLALFLYTGSDYPNPETCICTSTFTSPSGHEKPELDDFMYVPYTDLHVYVTERMVAAIRSAIKSKFNE